MLSRAHVSIQQTDAVVQLAGNVAHELNNIFTAVAGNLSFLEGALVADDYNSRLVRDVIHTVDRGIALSCRLQAIAGHLPLRRVKVDVNQAVIHVVTELKKSILRAADVRLDLARGLCLVSADPEKLHTVLAELANNAAIAMGYRGTLTLATALVDVVDRDEGGPPAGRYVRISVSDTGRGMPPEVAAQALMPSFTARSGDTGGRWGLAECAGFVRQCCGAIRLFSEPDQGTLVEIDLPILAAAQAQRSAGSAQ